MPRLALLLLAAAPVHVVHGDLNVGGVHLGRTTLPQATKLFAHDGAHRVRRKPNSCVVTWPRIGLTVNFGTIGTDPTNPCTGGTAFTVTVANRGAWRTVLGLRVGDGTARVHALYPRAPHKPDGFWLVTRRACAEVGGARFPGLLARVRAGKVSALVAQVGICD
jgi:hypothetical protein